MFSDKNFFVGQAGGWITSLWQDISAPLATQKSIRLPTCNAREIQAVHVYAKQLCHGHFNVVLLLIFSNSHYNPAAAPRLSQSTEISRSRTLTTPHPPQNINGHFAICPTRMGFPSRIAVMAQSHGCSIAARQKALPRRAQIFFRHVLPFTRKHTTVLTASHNRALNLNTHHSNNCPRDFQLPLHSHYISPQKN